MMSFLDDMESVLTVLSRIFSLEHERCYDQDFVREKLTMAQNLYVKSENIINVLKCVNNRITLA